MVTIQKRGSISFNEAAHEPMGAPEAVEAAISRLGTEFGALDIKKLGGRKDEWRLRVGEWRAILEMDKAAGQIIVTRVLPRVRAYRGRP